MLDFLKKLLYSNKYSLLILIIFSLVIRLTRDYSFILSFIILTALYLIIGMLVEIVIDRYFPQLSDNTEDEDKNADKEVRRNAGRDSRKGADAANTRPTRQTRPVRTELPGRSTAPASASAPRGTASSVQSRGSAPVRGRETAPARTAASERPADRVRPNRNDASPEEPKVTSSYIKNAGSIPVDMERKLVRTAADFNSIKRNSDRMSSSDGRQTRSVYGGRNGLINNEPESLYKNKKPEPEPGSDSVSVTAAEPENEPVKPARSVSDNEADTDYTDYTTVSADDLSRISDSITREVDDRIRSRDTRRTRIVFNDDDLYASDVVRTPRRDPISDVSEALDEFDRSRTSKRQTHKRVLEDDKVNADIDKINRLFNHASDNDDDSDSDEDKAGHFNRLKKKR